VNDLFKKYFVMYIKEFVLFDDRHADSNRRADDR
jgi:hypothetical protein